jgi:hypothetical protein
MSQPVCRAFAWLSVLLLAAGPVTPEPAAAAPEGHMFAPIWELAFLNGVGPRVEEAGLPLRGREAQGPTRERA